MTTPSTPQDKLEAVTEAIVKAVPEIADTCDCGLPFKFCACNTFRQRECTLEDVLRAVGREGFGVDGNGQFMERDMYEGYLPSLFQWSLGRPLSEQSEECISFLYSLLCGN